MTIDDALLLLIASGMALSVFNLYHVLRLRADETQLTRDTNIDSDHPQKSVA
jgi:hypothetical protein